MRIVPAIVKTKPAQDGSRAPDSLSRLYRGVQRISDFNAKAVLIMLTEGHVREGTGDLRTAEWVRIFMFRIDVLTRCRLCATARPRASGTVFLGHKPEFVRDKEAEFRYLMMAYPFDWLRRVAQD